MKDTGDIEERLKKLQKYSLDNEAKRKIMQKLSSPPMSSKKKLRLLPIIAIMSFFSIILILALPFLPGTDKNEPHNYAEPGPLEFIAPAGKYFTKNSRQTVFGLEGKVALLMNDFVAKDNRRVAKLFIYFWGDSDSLVDMPYEVKAMNTYGEELTLSTGTLSKPLNNEDAQTLTKFQAFPNEGEWKLSFYVNEELYGEFTVDVLPAFASTANYTLLDSPLEMNIGEESEITIESSTKEKEEILVELLNEDGKVLSENYFIHSHGGYNSSITFHHYNGELLFPYEGTWTLRIDGEKTSSFTN
ncbi:hypothetical protein WAK64_13400 [Bacillus spongiae]|uniref:DUF4871 domain-containing protein n=1 Tax=Bacillus spongiae TaxID=2683610 RepID=A0ABU8HFA5_9BACI